MKLLITGANGFLGSHLVETSLKKGYETTAALRDGSDISNLNDLSGYRAQPIDYSSVEAIKNSLKKIPPQDLIIHNAGLTKSFSLDKYIKVNVDITQRLIQAIKETKLLNPSGNFVYISSLAAKGPVGNNGPASNYGSSKLMAEEVVKSSNLNYMIFRPTGIYGTRDVQFVPLIKAVKLGIYPSMTPKKHKMTLINVKDVAENVIECSLNHQNETVHLDDGHVYENSDLKNILESILGKRSTNLRLSGSIVKSVLSLSDLIDRNLKRTPKLSREQYSEISQDWNFDFTQERKRLPLTIKYPLKEGFDDAIAHYKTRKLI